MEKYPLISVIMNCYNGEKYLEEAINSVLSQTYSNWEIIFWDNRSSDNSAAIFKSYTDPRLKYFYAPKHTVLYEARNLAIRESKGDLIGFLDVDDWWTSEKLSTQVDCFESDKVGLVCSSYFLVNERKKSQEATIAGPFSSGQVLNELLEHYFIHVSTLVIRREAIYSLPYWCDPRFNIIGDLDIVIRLVLNWELISVPEPLAYYRWHEQNTGFISDYQIADELSVWIEEIKLIDQIREQPAFETIVARTQWYNAIKCVYDGNRFKALGSLSGLTTIRKIKVLGVLFLPTFLARKLILS